MVSFVPSSSKGVSSTRNLLSKSFCCSALPFLFLFFVGFVVVVVVVVVVVLVGLKEGVVR